MALSAPTSHGKLFDVDLRLRPSGRSGPLATHIRSFERYHAESAWVWEQMALTRARVVTGEPTVGERALKAIHDGVVRDLTQGLLALGLLEGELEANIDSDAYRRFYLHSTSHWLGLDVHDVGDYRLDGEPRGLLPGMVLTVEPGLYVPDAEDIPAEYRGIGIRIEDDVAVTVNGHEVLTAAVPKRVEDIEALMVTS